jgi:hypothetical protein
MGRQVVLRIGPGDAGNSFRLLSKLSEKIGPDENLFFTKRNAPSPFTGRLSGCRLTFTKPPTPPNRSVPSRLSKASTTSRFAAIRKLAKERGV